MFVFRYNALFGLRFIEILNCETASLFRGGMVGASGGHREYVKVSVVRIVLQGGAVEIRFKYSVCHFIFEYLKTHELEPNTM